MYQSRFGRGEVGGAQEQRQRQPDGHEVEEMQQPMRHSRRLGTKP
jgi:hypothetical protein